MEKVLLSLFKISAEISKAAEPNLLYVVESMEKGSLLASKMPCMRPLCRRLCHERIFWWFIRQATGKVTAKLEEDFEAICLVSSILVTVFHVVRSHLCHCTRFITMRKTLITHVKERTPMEIIGISYLKFKMSLCVYGMLCFSARLSTVQAQCMECQLHSMACHRHNMESPSPPTDHRPPRMAPRTAEL